MSKVICNICGQSIEARKSSSMGAFPKQHKREGSVDPCHGFFVASNNYPKGEDNGQIS